MIYNNTAVARENMIKQQLRTGDVLDDDLLALIRDVKREDYVPADYREFAFSDMHIPIGQGQTMLTPLEEGLILQALKIAPSETVLEIGTGTGYFTELLSRQAKKVYSIDIFPEFSQEDSGNIQYITGDAINGWLEKAPYDVIVSTGAHHELPEIFKPQLMQGGRLFVLLGKSPAVAGVLMQLDVNNNWQKEIVFETDIAPLIDKTVKDDFVF